VITYGSFVPSNVMVMADGWLWLMGEVRSSLRAQEEEVVPSTKCMRVRVCALSNIGINTLVSGRHQRSNNCQ
jgi:hypothetical protein